MTGLELSFGLLLVNAMTKGTRLSQFNLGSSSDEEDDYSGFLSSSSERQSEVSAR